MPCSLATTNPTVPLLPQPAPPAPPSLASYPLPASSYPCLPQAPTLSPGLALLLLTYPAQPGSHPSLAGSLPTLEPPRPKLPPAPGNLQPLGGLAPSPHRPPLSPGLFAWPPFLLCTAPLPWTPLLACLWPSATQAVCCPVPTIFLPSHRLPPSPCLLQTGPGASCPCQWTSLDLCEPGACQAQGAAVGEALGQAGRPPALQEAPSSQ